MIEIEEVERCSGWLKLTVWVAAVVVPWGLIGGLVYAVWWFVQ
jgi:hypothetical protein